MPTATVRLIGHTGKRRQHPVYNVVEHGGGSYTVCPGTNSVTYMAEVRNKYGVFDRKVVVIKSAWRVSEIMEHVAKHLAEQAQGVQAKCQAWDREFYDHPKSGGESC